MLLFFFFKQKTAYEMRISDWSSDVCSSDLKSRRETGGTLAGYVAYEAGLALEQRLFPLADQRSGATGPLVWLGLFEGAREIAAEEVSAWLDARAGNGEASLGPLVPQLSVAEYQAAFARLQEAIRAGDIYQVNLTYQIGRA